MAVPIRMGPSGWQRILDHALFPVNMWLGESASQRLGLTPIDHERVRAALDFCTGRVLDVACGNNLLVRTHGNGFGVDMHPYPEADVLCRCPDLPFKDEQFDTVAILAALNHIVRRRETLRECRRVLRPEGRLLITMIAPWVGFFSHPIRKRHDPDQLERGITKEEDLGLTRGHVCELVETAGFRWVAQRRFLWGLNNLYVAEKSGAAP